MNTVYEAERSGFYRDGERVSLYVGTNVKIKRNRQQKFVNKLFLSVAIQQ